MALTTTYGGEYSIAGTPWIPIDGTVDIASPPIPLRAIQTRTVLVADTQQP